jgi:hypothetical protein
MFLEVSLSKIKILMKNKNNYNYKNFGLSSAVCIMVIFISLLSGCSGGGIKGLVPCEGVVKVNGQPLADASIAFAPTKTNGRSAGGMTNSDGYYKLSTNLNVGVLPDEYKVTIIKSIPATEKDVQLIKEMYEAAEKGIASSGDDVVVNFKSLTGKYANPQTSDLTVIISGKGNKQQNFDLVVEEK